MLCERNGFSFYVAIPGPELFEYFGARARRTRRFVIQLAIFWLSASELFPHVLKRQDFVPRLLIEVCSRAPYNVSRSSRRTSRRARFLRKSVDYTLMSS